MTTGVITGEELDVEIEKTRRQINQAKSGEYEMHEIEWWKGYLRCLLDLQERVTLRRQEKPSA